MAVFNCGLLGMLSEQMSKMNASTSALVADTGSGGYSGREGVGIGEGSAGGGSSATGVFCAWVFVRDVKDESKDMNGSRSLLCSVWVLVMIGDGVLLILQVFRGDQGY